MNENLGNGTESVWESLTFDCDEHRAAGAEDLRLVEDVGREARVETAVFRGRSEKEENGCFTSNRRPPPPPSSVCSSRGHHHTAKTADTIPNRVKRTPFTC